MSIQEVVVMESRCDYGLKLVYKLLAEVFPLVSLELEAWSSLASSIQDPLLGKQALASIALKKFHAQGGSAYALYPSADLKKSVIFIVSLQTISDYLDNLCDRSGITDEKAFRQLHLSMLEAVDSEPGISDYYLYYPYKADNNYLKRLVEKCRQCVSELPSYNLVKDTIKKYIGLYSDLQAYKHLNPESREKLLLEWANGYTGQYDEISGWEFCAASGSTLGIFVLFAAAADPRLTAGDVAKLESAYFPWICGLHILLDYYIDAREDIESGDLNFTFYYDNPKQCEERLSFFIRKALKHCSGINHGRFHETVVRGLLAMYLSDPKASDGMNRRTSRNLVKAGGFAAGTYYSICRFIRFSGML